MSISHSRSQSRVVVSIALAAFALVSVAGCKRRTTQPIPGMQAYPGQIPGMQAYGQPGQMPGQMPGQYPGMMPGQMPGQMPQGMPGQMPGQMPGMGMGMGLMVPPPVQTSPDNPMLPIPPPGVMRQIAGSQ